MDDTINFELELAKLVLPHTWKHEYKSFRYGKTYAVNKSGVMTVTSIENRREIQRLLLDLYTGFTPRDNFIWQRAAKQLGLITLITATDQAECRYCNTITVLTVSKLCTDCKRTHDVVTQFPHIAERVLKEMKS